MKLLAILMIAGLMYVTPVLLLDQMVLPQLQALKNVYDNADGLVTAKQPVVSNSGMQPALYDVQLR